MGAVWTQYLLYRNPESTHLIVRWSHYNTPLQDKNQAKETIEGGPCKWGGINGTDHPLNHQVLSINLGSARMLSIHTRLMTWSNT